MSRYGGVSNVPELHPTKDMAIKCSEVKGALSRMADIKEDLATNVIYQKEAGSCSDQVRFTTNPLKHIIPLYMLVLMHLAPPRPYNHTQRNPNRTAL